MSFDSTTNYKPNSLTKYEKELGFLSFKILKVFPLYPILKIQWMFFKGRL
jgi:hypothetical protein